MKKYKFLVFNIFRKRKLCRYAFIIFFVMICSYITIFGLNRGISIKYDLLKRENIESSYVVLNSKETYQNIVNDIRKESNVKNYYPVMYYSNEKYNFIYYDDNLIKLIAGKNIVEKYDIIVPEDLNKNIDDIIDLQIDNTIYKLRVVGIYTSNNYRFSIDNDVSQPIFASYEFLNKIVNIDNIHEAIVQVDDYDNLNKFINDILECGDYDVMVYDLNSSLLDRYHNFSEKISILSNILAVFISLFVIIVHCIIIHDNKLDIAILKSIGYSNTKILFLISLYSILLFSIALLPSVLLTSLLYIISNGLIVFSINIIIKCIVDYLIITAFITLIFYYIVKRNSIIKLMKN